MSFTIAVKRGIVKQFDKGESLARIVGTLNKKRRKVFVSYDEVENVLRECLAGMAQRNRTSGAAATKIPPRKRA